MLMIFVGFFYQDKKLTNTEHAWFQRSIILDIYLLNGLKILNLCFLVVPV